MGLLAGQPCRGRPFGVYVFANEFRHPTFSRLGRVIWMHGEHQDLWSAAYIGPITEDQYVENGLVFLHAIPPEHVSLVRAS